MVQSFEMTNAINNEMITKEEFNTSAEKTWENLHSVESFKTSIQKTWEFTRLESFNTKHVEDFTLFTLLHGSQLMHERDALMDNEDKEF